MQPPLDPSDLEHALGLFRLSRLLHAAVTLGIAPLLAESPRDAPSLSKAAGLHPSAACAFLDALAAWGVLRRENDTYALTPCGRRLLPDEPGALSAPLIAGWAGLPAVLEAFGGLEHSLRTGESGLQQRHGTDFHGYLSRHPAQARLYSEAMDSTTDSFEAAATLIDFSGCELIADVGGGRGGLLACILQRHPKIRGVCQDLPHVVGGLPPRCDGRLTFEAGNAFEQVPHGADIILLSTVLRCFDDARCVALLRSIRRAMTRPGARLICLEMLLPPGKDDPWLALTHITARVVYGGQDRTGSEFARLFARAGLSMQSATPVLGAVHALTCTAATPPVEASATTHGGSVARTFTKTERPRQSG
jgi:hypothetical protein